MSDQTEWQQVQPQAVESLTQSSLSSKKGLAEVAAGIATRNVSKENSVIYSVTSSFSSSFPSCSSSLSSSSSSLSSSSSSSFSSHVSNVSSSNNQSCLPQSNQTNKTDVNNNVNQNTKDNKASEPSTSDQQPILRPSSERPTIQLTVRLLRTYKHINKLFFKANRNNQATKAAKQLVNDGYDDKDGNYLVQVGEVVFGRFIVQDQLGKGSFGVVVKAHDHRKDECVAVKIIRNKHQFIFQAKAEIEILQKLWQSSTKANLDTIVALQKVFVWKGHPCLVFELLSCNLYDLLQKTQFRGVSLNLIRKFAIQLLRTLDHLETEGIIHCDLKPENVLLKDFRHSAVKVIDFGSSCYVNKSMYKYIQSRFYRSPEVILGLPYDCAIDIWSLGAILVELHTGVPLFDGKDEAEQLLKFTTVLGPPPLSLLKCSPKRGNFYRQDATTLNWELIRGKPSMQTTVETIIASHKLGPNGWRSGQAGHSEDDYKSFYDLVASMLEYDPKKRIHPKPAMDHSFVVVQPPSIGATTPAISSTVNQQHQTTVGLNGSSSFESNTIPFFSTTGSMHSASSNPVSKANTQTSMRHSLTWQPTQHQGKISSIPHCPIHERPYSVPLKCEDNNKNISFFSSPPIEFCMRPHSSLPKYFLQQQQQQQQHQNQNQQPQQEQTQQTCFSGDINLPGNSHNNDFLASNNKVPSSSPFQRVTLPGGRISKQYGISPANCIPTDCVPNAGTMPFDASQSVSKTLF